MKKLVRGLILPSVSELGDTEETSLTNGSNDWDHSQRDKGGQSSAFEKDHLSNFDNNGIGMTQGSPGASRSEEVGRGSDQTSEGHELNSAGLRKNGAAVGAGQNTVRLQATDKRAREDFGSGQGLPLVIPSDLSSAHWGETKSGAKMNYIKHRTKNFFRFLSMGEPRLQVFFVFVLTRLVWH